MIPQSKIDQCEEVNGHVNLPGLYRCWCGFKKYPKPKPTPRCGACGEEPHLELAQEGPNAGKAVTGVFCVTEDCPAFNVVVTPEIWLRRGPHEMAVMHIPTSEPIFTLRAQDKLAMVPAYTWVELAEKHGVDYEKVTRAMVDINAMRDWQGANETKIPD